MKLFNLKNFKITHKGLYLGLIIAFALLYLCVGFVSTLHSITFFGLANSIGLAILLGLTYEIGQASVLFSILMTRNKDKFLPWALMFLLTALQVTANVYASFKFMANSGNTDYIYWQKSILFGVQAANPEMYQVIISWIAGALLPIVALGMTALVAQNIKLMSEEEDAIDPLAIKPKDVAEEFKIYGKIESEKPEDINIISDIPADIPSREDQLEILKEKVLENVVGKASDLENHPKLGEGGIQIIEEPLQIDLKTQAQANKEFEDSLVKFPVSDKPSGGQKMIDEIVEEMELYEKESQEKIQEKEQNDDLDREVESLTPELNLPSETKIVKAEIIQIPVSLPPEEKPEIKVIISKKALKEVGAATRRELGEKIPFTKTRGWHLKKEYIDSNGDIYHFGKFFSPKIDKPEESKKAKERAQTSRKKQSSLQNRKQILSKNLISPPREKSLLTESKKKIPKKKLKKKGK
jgi:hypothetical protein